MVVVGMVRKNENGECETTRREKTVVPHAWVAERYAHGAKFGKTRDGRNTRKFRGRQGRKYEI
jgi:hypothetical protein